MNVYRSFTHNSQKLDANCGCVLSRFSRLRLFATPWTIVCQATLSMEFSRQECWTGLPCPPPGDLPDPGTEPTSLMSPALAVIRTWYNLHKFNQRWFQYLTLLVSDAACIFGHVNPISPSIITSPPSLSFFFLTWTFLLLCYKAPGGSICPTCKIQDNLSSGFLIISVKSFLPSKVKFSSSLEHGHHWGITVQSTQSTSAIPQDKFIWAIAVFSSITGAWSKPPWPNLVGGSII